MSPSNLRIHAPSCIVFFSCFPQSCPQSLSSFLISVPNTTVFSTPSSLIPLPLNFLLLSSSHLSSAISACPSLTSPSQPAVFTTTPIVCCNFLVAMCNTVPCDCLMDVALPITAATSLARIFHPSSAAFRVISALDSKSACFSSATEYVISVELMWNPRNFTSCCGSSTVFVH